MSSDAIGRLPLRAGACLLVGLTIANVLWTLLATFVVFRDSAIPALFAVAATLPVGANGYLLGSYLIGGLASYAFFYRGGYDRLRERL
jgi:hypothetical protein